MHLRNILVLPLLGSCLTATAQIQKGSTFLGGDLSFSTESGSSSNNINYKTGGFYVLPAFGKAIKENLIVGTDILYWYNHSDVSDDFNDLKQWVYGAGIFIRQYQLIPKTKFALFIQGNLSVENDNTKQGYNTPDKIETVILSVGLGLRPGMSYTISKKLQLETGFNNLVGARYFHRTSTSGTVNPVTGKASGFNLYASLENETRFYVGFRLLIRKN